MPDFESRLKLAIWIMLGGGLGSVFRFFVQVNAGKLFSTSFPIGTLLVNVVGGFAIGLLSQLPVVKTNRDFQLFLITGLLGGFTTFSAFSFETMNLWKDTSITLAMINIILNVCLSVLACFLGSFLIGLFSTN